jgi:hypothetical protein
LRLDSPTWQHHENNNIGRLLTNSKLSQLEQCISKKPKLILLFITEAGCACRRAALACRKQRYVHTLVWTLTYALRIHDV